MKSIFFFFFFKVLALLLNWLTYTRKVIVKVSSGGNFLIYKWEVKYLNQKLIFVYFINELESRSKNASAERAEPALRKW